MIDPERKQIITLKVMILILIYGLPDVKRMCERT